MKNKNKINKKKEKKISDIYNSKKKTIRKFKYENNIEKR